MFRGRRACAKRAAAESRSRHLGAVAMPGAAAARMRGATRPHDRTRQQLRAASEVPSLCLCHQREGAMRMATRRSNWRRNRAARRQEILRAEGEDAGRHHAVDTRVPGGLNLPARQGTRVFGYAGFGRETLEEKYAGTRTVREGADLFGRTDPSDRCAALQRSQRSQRPGDQGRAGATMQANASRGRPYVRRVKSPSDRMRRRAALRCAVLSKHSADDAAQGRGS